mmetsp:Transcript_6209/g.10014  ORF Transcript_6209/g.10014 Transcript_6209/m.10014 type:complete len:226 (-) Transcript_6209:12-689(-)
MVLPSWQVMTPSLPTRSMAVAMSLPTWVSPLAEMVATCSISSLEVMGLLMPSSLRTMLSTAVWIPRRRSIGLYPAATALQPSLKMARARTVEVVVPSPAMSLVLEATWRTRRAPRFSMGSSNSMALATVTPSLVTLGAPKACWMTTLRPLGPRVTWTVSARRSTPASIPLRASTPNFTSLAKLRTCILLPARAAAAPLRARALRNIFICVLFCRLSKTSFGIPVG